MKSKKLKVYYNERITWIKLNLPKSTPQNIRQKVKAADLASLMKSKGNGHPGLK